MSMLILGFLTVLVSVVTGATLLMQMGGWLPILVAILLLMGFMGHLIITVMLVSIVVDHKRKEKKDEGIRTEASDSDVPAV